MWGGEREVGEGEGGREGEEREGGGGGEGGRRGRRGMEAREEREGGGWWREVCGKEVGGRWEVEERLVAGRMVEKGERWRGSWSGCGEGSGQWWEQGRLRSESNNTGCGKWW